MKNTNKQKLWFRLKVISEESDLEKAYGAISCLFPNTALQETDLENGKKQLELYLSSEENSHITSKQELNKKISSTFENAELKYEIEEYHYDPSQEAEWKKYFKPQKIGKNIVIKPSWETYKEKSNDIIVVIDPGAAFGTGLHETTRGSIILLEQVLDLEQNNKDKIKLLDAGTGSGVLAISAYKLGINNIYAIDNDPDAVDITKDNFKLNNIEKNKIIAEANPLEAINAKEKYGIILANIISHVLISNKKLFGSILEPPAHLILSGILSRDEESVLNAFVKEENFSLVRKLHLGEWSSLWLRKNIN